MTLEQAVSMLYKCDLLAAVSTILCRPNTDEARLAIQRYPLAKWATLQENYHTVYTESEFCLVSNPKVYAEVFRSAFNITTRFRVDSFNQRCVKSWMSSSVIYESFVLSKTRGNMAWHVDGGEKSKSDLVIYMILGPTDAISCFMLLTVDTGALLQAQHEDASFASADEIYAGLSSLDKLSVAMNDPELVECRATLHGLERFPELNGTDVTIVKHLTNGIYRVTLDSSGKDKKVHAKHLLVHPQFCVFLPEEIKQISASLPLATARAIAKGVVRCYCIWGRAGQVVVFDGSKPHGVYNFPSASAMPQLALAVNYRGVLPQIVNHMRSRRVSFKPN